MLATPVSAAQMLNARAAREGWTMRCDDTLAFADARLTDLAQIWEAVRGAKELPRRADFTARALARHLRDIAFLERMPQPGAPHCYRFGFYGSGLARYTGDWTGKFLDEIVPPEQLAAWQLAYDTGLAHGAPLRIDARITAYGLDYMNAESFVAPLGDANGAPCGLLTSVSYTPRVA